MYLVSFDPALDLLKDYVQEDVSNGGGSEEGRTNEGVVFAKNSPLYSSLLYASGSVSQSRRAIPSSLSPSRPPPSPLAPSCVCIAYACMCQLICLLPWGHSAMPCLPYSPSLLVSDYVC